MMRTIEDKFLRNQKTLENKFNFEIFTRQLTYLSQYPKSFKIEPSELITRKASMLKKKIIHNAHIDSRFKNTILYIQSKELINQYILERTQ